MVNKNRPLRIFKYLWDHTDESHPATTADIIEHLASLGITTTRKTVAEDVAELQESALMMTSLKTLALYQIWWIIYTLRRIYDIIIYQ